MLAQGCFRWSLDLAVLDSEQRSNRCCPRPVVSQWIEISLGHLRRNMTHPGSDDRLRNACREERRIGRVSQRVNAEARPVDPRSLQGGSELAIEILPQWQPLPVCSASDRSRDSVP